MSTPYHSAYWALLLSVPGTSGTVDSLSRSIANSRVDLNPHQVDAALFALRSPLSRGVLLADEVGLGKTVEAGLVVAQRWAERKRRILVIVPAILRAQWHRELEEKFLLPVRVVDGRSLQEARRSGEVSALDDGSHVLVCSYHLASSRADEISRTPWDLVVIDEAHRLRNVYKPRVGMARRITDAVRSAPKLLLTATPLQNSLMELYGLVSVLDNQVFGDELNFRERFARAPGEVLREERLRERLKPICTRTLRRQVQEYVRFTKRTPITQDFYPSDDEHRFYEEVSAYLQREDLLALPRQQREFTVLVLRKLLASSTHAIGPTLRALADRLEGAARERTLFEDSDIEGLAELEEEFAESPADTTAEANPAPEPSRLRKEIAELRRLAGVAESIGNNAKGEALVPTLATAFARAEALGAPRKAVIFTESRRTQAYLVDVLSRRGFEGEVAALNGTNSDPASRQILEDWLASRGSRGRSEARSTEAKTAIIDHFRDSASILVATEAAAEGVNLQFCSLVVNYDLPWNPQRIEQRIGRCHRYGQQHDVVVVNFLNRRNEADQRVFELLSEKLRLFEGVFGASDEVLGALESGVDLERRIAEVYRTCRSKDEIDTAFDSLQSELDVEIQARMRETRTALLENFDDEVAERLRIHRDRTLEALSERERHLIELSRYELGEKARFNPEAPRFEYLGGGPSEAEPGFYNFDWKEAERLGDVFYRPEHPLAQELIERALSRDLPAATLVLETQRHGVVPSVVKALVGRAGWLALARLRAESFDASEFAVLAGRTSDARGETALDEEQCRRLLSLPGRVEDLTGPAPASIPEVEHVARRRLLEVELRNRRAFEEQVSKLDLWSADLKDGLEREIRELDRRVQDASRDAALAQELAAKVSEQKRVRKLEATRTRKRRELFAAQDEIDGQREELIGKMEKQLACRSEITVRFLARWVVE